MNENQPSQNQLIRFNPIKKPIREVEVQKANLPNLTLSVFFKKTFLIEQFI
jgi:hypothetical protein